MIEIKNETEKVILVGVSLSDQDDTKESLEELKDLDLGCDFIVGSGAEVRNPKGEILKSIGFTYEICNEVAKVLEEYPISVLYCAGPYE